MSRVPWVCRRSCSLILGTPDRFTILSNDCEGEWGWICVPAELVNTQPVGSAPTTACSVCCRARRMATAAADRTGRRRRRTNRLGIHQLRRYADPSPLALAIIRENRETIRSPQDQAARPTTHPRHPAHLSRDTSQGRFGTARTWEPCIHHRHLPARPPRNAS